MFRELRLTNFKSFAEEQTIPFAPVTLFVGANASGKSNALDALRFLQGLALGFSIAECLSGKREGGIPVFPGIRGGAAEVCWKGSDRFRIDCAVTVRDDPRFHMMIDIATEERYVDPTAELSHVPWELVHRIAVEVPRLESANGSAPLIEDECLRMERFAGDQQDDGTVIRGTRDAGDRVQLGIGTRPMFRLDKRLFDRTVLRLGRGLIGMHQLPVVNAFRSGLAEIQFIDLTPSAMKDYVSSQIHDLGDQGQNLSQIVHRVSEDDQTRQRLLEWISEVSAPRIVDFDFEVTRLGDVLLYLVEEDGRRISARSLSDGTLRFLGYLAAVFSAEEGSVLLFEEIENGLHPTRVHLLVELFEQLAALRNIQIIATTHSSQVLLALSREALESVVLFARNEEHPGTIVRRLGELPHFHETIERTHIDELFTTGWLEFAV